MYPYINGTLVGSDVTEMFVYANTVTGGWAVPMIVMTFFLTTLIVTMMMQLRFSSRIRPDVCFIAASFASLGFATILIQKSGLLNPTFFIITLSAFILSLIWAALSE